MKRKALPSATQIEVLTRSGRRCVLCFGLSNDFGEKAGQIAHLDKDPTNDKISNLAFLCLDHHDKYDSTNSQSKGYQKSEVVAYRDQLYHKVQAELRTESIFDKEVSIEEDRFERIHQIIEKFWRMEKSPGFLAAEIFNRCSSLYEFSKLYEEWLASSDHYEPGPQFEFFHERELKRLQVFCGIPEDIYGLPDSALPDDWLASVKELSNLFAAGLANRHDCHDIWWEFDECYDLDATWLIFGIQNCLLPRLAYQLFQNFIYNFGTRNMFSEESDQEFTL